jgi:hypothetical protein
LSQGFQSLDVGILQQMFNEYKNVASFKNCNIISLTRKLYGQKEN